MDLQGLETQEKNEHLHITYMLTLYKSFISWNLRSRGLKLQKRQKLSFTSARTNIIN